MRRTALLLMFVTFTAAVAAAQDRPLLANTPTLSRTHIAFVYAGDLWTVPRGGGDAVRLTTGVGVETRPLFSPDGTTLAFTAEYDGNLDVYTVPATGGVPRRLTYHPGTDIVTGWTPDGAKVLFVVVASERERTVQPPVLDGRDRGLPGSPALADGHTKARSHPTARASRTSPSPGLQHLETVSRRPGHAHLDRAPRRLHRGTRAPQRLERLQPDVDGRRPRSRVLPVGPRRCHHALRLRHGHEEGRAHHREQRPRHQVGLGRPDAIVYEQFGGLHLFDIKGGKSRRVDIRVTADMAGVRARYEKVGDAHQQLRPVADWRTGGLRGARRHPQRAGRKGRCPQPDQFLRRGRTRPGLVSRRPMDRLFLRRVGRIRPAPARPDRTRRREEDRPRDAAVLLLRAHLVARQQEGRVLRQAHDPLVRLDRKRRADSRGRIARRRRRDDGAGLVAGQPVDRLREDAQVVDCARSSSTRSTTGRAIR